MYHRIQLLRLPLFIEIYCSTFEYLSIVVYYCGIFNISITDMFIEIESSRPRYYPYFRNSPYNPQISSKISF